MAMLKSLIRGSLSVLKWALCGVGALALLLTGPGRNAACTPAGAAVDLGGPRHRRSSAPCPRSSGSRPATAPGSASAIMPRAARRRAARRSWCTAPPAPAAAPSMRCRRRWRRAAWRPLRSISAATARQARAAISAMSASSRTISPISSRSLRKTAPTAPLTLVGHSSGGGFALRVAGSPIQNLFERTVLLAPYLGYDAPTTRPSSGGWANADIPRIVGLMALRGVGITCCEALPVLAFAVPPNSEKNLVSDLYRPADAQLCGQRRFPPRSRRRDQTAHDHLRRRRRIDVRGQICRGRARREGRRSTSS